MENSLIGYRQSRELGARGAGEEKSNAMWVFNKTDRGGLDPHGKEPKLKTTNREKRAHDVNTAYPLDVRRSEVKAPKVIILTRLGRPRRRGGWICCCRAGGCSGLH